MKYLATLIITIYFFTSSVAQVNLGVQSSIGFSIANDEASFSGDAFDYINHEVTYKGANLVKSYGLFAQQKFGFLFGRTELAFTHYKQEYLIRSFIELGQPPQTQFEKFEYIDFRILAGITHNNA